MVHEPTQKEKNLSINIENHILHIYHVISKNFILSLISFTINI